MPPLEMLDLSDAARRAAARTTERQASRAGSTERGYSGSASPTIDRFLETFKVEHDRQNVLRDIHRMMADDPRVAEANDQLVQMVLFAGVDVRVIGPRREDKEINQLARRAQLVIDRTRKTNQVDAKLPGWARKLIQEGDLFVQRIVSDSELAGHKRMPAISMRRNTDLADNFTDPSAAFFQKDATSDQVVATFALWQIIHVRWHETDGNRYGEPQYLQIRRVGRALAAAADDLMVRRRTRAPQRVLWNIGTADRPGEADEVEAFKDTNSLKRLDETGRLQQSVDLYGNGLVDAKVISSDANLGDIGDIVHLQNIQSSRLGVPKAFLSGDEQVGREVLQEQREQSQRAAEALRFKLAWLLREIYDFALLLEGINPEAVSYSIVFRREISSAQFDSFKGLAMLVQNNIVSRKTALRLVANALGLEDLDAEWMQVIEEFNRFPRRRATDKESSLTGVNENNLEERPSPVKDDETISAVERASLGRPRKPNGRDAAYTP